MARLPRYIIPGQPQHVIVRGNNRNEIFCADADYRFYLEKLQQACEKQYDLVVCSEVLEHIQDWRVGVRNIACWSRKCVLITVPSGKIYPIDKHVGHLRHFDSHEICCQLISCMLSDVLNCRDLFHPSQGLFHGPSANP